MGKVGGGYKQEERESNSNTIGGLETCFNVHFMFSEYIEEKYMIYLGY
jgi:hypothetical protein